MTTVAILTDIHMRTEHRNDIIETLEVVQSKIFENHDPLHLFVLGDLIQDVGPETDRRHLQAVASVLESSGVPVTYLLGNHDTGSLSRDELSEILSQDQFYGRVMIEDHHFVYLDSSQACLRVRGALGPDQRAWLQGKVPEQSIILSHHPIGQFSLTDNVWFGDYPERAILWDRKELFEIIEKNAIATLNGHIHQTERSRFHGLSHVSINAFSKERPDKPVTGTYAILSLNKPVQITEYQVGKEISSFQL